ncbi:histidine kinase [Elizabethkingia sp. YR214]|uniref:sensor histidine kinase n=1 Tax=Elizabethkingia sp. YR214 TaxID=2135667 RepID=UPI000D30B764|nr:histidine kinase [Elizabethkingia sp. YR214]PUB32733.1 histidine kinase [Elizabethkingia sp. YR214]
MKNWLNKNGIRIGLNIILLIIIFKGLYSDATKPYSDGNPIVSNIYIVKIFLLNAVMLLGAFINNFFLIPRYLIRYRWVKYIICVFVLFFLTTIFSSVFWNHLIKMYPQSCQCNYSILAIYINNNDVVNQYFRTYPNIIFYMLVFAIGYFIQYGFQKVITRKQIEAHQRESELMLLKSQVNPHFLFNIMNTIYSLSLKKSDKAPHIILKLSEILRYNLYETNTPFVSLDKELRIIENYIDLEKARLKYPEKVSFINKVKGEEIEIAPLLILPLVENAFKHGIDSNIEQGFIEIIVSENNNSFNFQCRNNYKEKKKKQEPGGLGFKNLKKRLDLIYPNRHSLNIDSSKQIFEVILKIQLK